MQYCDPSTLASSLGVEVRNVEFKQDEHGGVGAYATRKIHRGDLIIEVPYHCCIIGNSSEELARILLSSSSDYALSLSREIGRNMLEPLVNVSGSGLERWHSLSMSRNQTAYEQLTDKAEIPLSLFIWANSIVSSRAFIIPGDRSALVPIADLLNHANRSNCEVDRRDNSIAIIAHEDIEVGTELTHCKNSHGSFALFLLCLLLIIFC